MEDTSIFDFGVKHLAAEMIALGLNDLSSRDLSRRADAKSWIRKDSLEPFGFRWCIVTCGVSGNLIRTMVHKILHEGKTFERLRMISRRTKQR